MTRDSGGRALIAPWLCAAAALLTPLAASAGAIGTVKTADSSWIRQVTLLCDTDTTGEACSLPLGSPSGMTGFVGFDAADNLITFSFHGTNATTAPLLFSLDFQFDFPGVVMTGVQSTLAANGTAAGPGFTAAPPAGHTILTITGEHAGAPAGLGAGIGTACTSGAGHSWDCAFAPAAADFAAGRRLEGISGTVAFSIPGLAMAGGSGNQFGADGSIIFETAPEPSTFVLFSAVLGPLGALCVRRRSRRG
jgi:hypothetical protein